MDQRDVCIVSVRQQGVGGIARLHLRYAVHRRHRFHVTVGKTEGGKQADIHHIGIVIISIRRFVHIGRRGDQSEQKAHAQRRNPEDRQQAALHIPHPPEKHGRIGGLSRTVLPVLLFLFFHRRYHSICATGRGDSFRSQERIFPLLTRITRSAIAVSAPLWVMMITVFPVCRQVFCKRERMAFPVT